MTSRFVGSIVPLAAMFVAACSSPMQSHDAASDAARDDVVPDAARDGGEDVALDAVDAVDAVGDAGDDVTVDARDVVADTGPSCSQGTVDTGPTPTGAAITIDATMPGFRLAPDELGANMNKWYGHAQGLWNATTNAPVMAAVDRARRAGLGLLRHPGGTSANLFRWKRSVGPRAQRRCQTDGESFTARLEREYGPPEFMEFVRAVGAEPQMMVPFTNMSPAEAADWVEYMNAPQGTNPNGGTAWADVRARDGHPEPFHATRWEVGNEPERNGLESYWIATSTDPSPSAADRQRLEQFIAGDDFVFTDQSAGRECDLTDPNTTTDPGQRFYLRYGLIRAGNDPVVKVGGTVWNRVDDLATAGPNAHVYTLDRDDASFQFGDGTHGAIPAAGQRVTVTYRFHHDGFVAIYDAMKATADAIGERIDVCAAWAFPLRRGTPAADIGEPSFATAMQRHGFASRYDCVAAHPYTSFSRDFGGTWSSTADAYDQHMLGDGTQRTMIANLSDDLAAHGAAGPDGRAPFVTISEFGALFFNDQGAAAAQVFPNYTASMTHAVYMASQFVHFARLHVGWVEGNTLVADPMGLRGVLGGSQTNFVYGAEAMTREAMAPFFATGSRWIPSRVDAVDDVMVGTQGSYPALVVGASQGSDGALRIIVVNRRRGRVQTATVVPGGFEHGATIEVATVHGASFESYIDGPSGPGDDSVTIDRTTRHVAHANFTFDFPAASVTVLTLRPPC